MANFLNKVKVKTATDDRVKLDLGSDHITTAGWMQFNVAYAKEMVPKEKIDLQMETLTRMLPLVRPTFGRANVNNRGFFVPFREIFPAWNDFITDAPHVKFEDTNPGTQTGAIVSSVHTVTNKVLATMFADTTTGFGTVVTGTGAYDYVVNDPNDDLAQGTTPWRLKLTSEGRQAMKILNSLGYVVSFDITNTQVYSALPILACVKIYTDWYWPSAYTADTYFVDLDSYTKIDGTHAFNVGELLRMFSVINWVCYDSDYFVSAFDNPNGPTSGTASNIIIRNVDTTTGNAQVGNFNTSILNGSAAIDYNNNATSAPITQFVIDSLKSLTDYLKRHQLVGSRAIDRYLARFGVNLNSEKANRSVYLGSHKVPVQIGDVVSTADTTGAGLGDYAGKGIGYNQNKFDYETDEYGMFMIISTIIPSVGYWQGIDRNVLHKTKLDYWTPEFDNLGNQAIIAAELKVGTNGAQANSSNTQYTQIFGYTPRYSEYKIGRDRLSGLFRYDSANTGEDAWYLMRDIDGIIAPNSASTQYVHSRGFMQGEADWYQYNRIFQNGNITVSADDVFKVIYHFEIASYAPMKALYDTYEFDSKGSEVTEDVNGVKMN